MSKSKFVLLYVNTFYTLGRIAQLVRAPALQAGGHRFESCFAHQPMPYVFVEIYSPIAQLVEHTTVNR